jgi:ribosomal protein S18 acetylase RimI-like enzyme
MDESEFQNFRRKSTRTYASDLATAFGVDPKKAMELATEQLNSILTNGLATANHHFQVIRIADSGISIGHLWYGVRDMMGKNRLFIYDISIDDSFRGKGYGTKVMKWLETRTRKHSCEDIVLQVFGHNTRALALYEKLGFKTVSSHLSKKV